MLLLCEWTLRIAMDGTMLQLHRSIQHHSPRDFSLAFWIAPLSTIWPVNAITEKKIKDTYYEWCPFKLENKKQIITTAHLWFMKKAVILPSVRSPNDKTQNLAQQNRLAIKSIDIISTFPKWCELVMDESKGYLKTIHNYDIINCARFQWIRMELSSTCACFHFQSNNQANQNNA